jgi:hypothetical protein
LTSFRADRIRLRFSALPPRAAHLPAEDEA